MAPQFGYNGKILETFTPFGIVDQSKEEFLMWLVKKDVLPWAYWTFMTKGARALDAAGRSSGCVCQGCLGQRACKLTRKLTLLS